MIRASISHLVPLLNSTMEDVCYSLYILECNRSLDLFNENEFVYVEKTPFKNNFSLSLICERSNKQFNILSINHFAFSSVDTNLKASKKAIMCYRCIFLSFLWIGWMSGEILFFP